MLQVTAALEAAGAEEVGKGGFGVVYAVELPSFSGWGRVAIKRALPGQPDDSVSNMMDEVALLRKCAHPNVLPLLGYCAEEKAVCMVTPLMRGGSLDDRLLLTPAARARLQRLGLQGRLELSWVQRHVGPRCEIPDRRFQLDLGATRARLYLTASQPHSRGSEPSSSRDARTSLHDTALAPSAPCTLVVLTNQAVGSL